jgi:hypothetical protein
VSAAIVQSVGRLASPSTPDDRSDMGEPSERDSKQPEPRCYTLRTEGTTWRELDDQIVVLDLDSSVYLNVTGSGAVVWELLARGTSLDAMLAAVLEVYDVEPEAARSDLLAFLDELTTRQLLR